MNRSVVIVAAIVLVIAAAGVYVLNGNGRATTTTTTQATSAYTTTSTITNVSTVHTTTVPPKTNSTVTYTVNLESSATLGSYLANASGFTLYTYSSDSPGRGVSACYSSCASAWPPFYTGKLILPNGLNASSFKTIFRTDGLEQLTYNGRPLYRFVGDSKAGETNGQNLGGFTVAVR